METRDPCHPYKCIKKFEMAMATKYTSHHWIVHYSEEQGEERVKYDIFVSDEYYRSQMEKNGFALVHSVREVGDRICEFWVLRET